MDFVTRGEGGHNLRVCSRGVYMYEAGDGFVSNSPNAMYDYHPLYPHSQTRSRNEHKNELYVGYLSSSLATCLKRLYALPIIYLGTFYNPSTS